MPRFKRPEVYTSDMGNPPFNPDMKSANTRLSPQNSNDDEDMIPSKAAMEDMRRIMEEKKQRKAQDAAYDEAVKAKYGKAKGGKVSKYAKGGYVRSADGVAQRGKTKGRMC